MGAASFGAALTVAGPATRKPAAPTVATVGVAGVTSRPYSRGGTIGTAGSSAAFIQTTMRVVGDPAASTVVCSYKWLARPPFSLSHYGCRCTIYSDYPTDACVGNAVWVYCKTIAFMCTPS